MSGSPTSWRSRFTASDAAFAPVLREVAKRGLMYLDDGTAPRSLAARSRAPTTCLRQGGRRARCGSDPQRDRPRAGAARRHGARNRIAVGSRPRCRWSIARIANWAKNAEARGFLLVPISAAAVKPKSS